MNGDITRSTFDPSKRYSSVRQQQGRVQIDADWNEQRDIELHDERSLRVDVIGPSGAPVADPGMEVLSTFAGLTVGTGTYYVDGIRCENDEVIAVPDLPTDAGLYLAYLDAWEMPITAVEDPTIREVALGGPDTATRTKVVWRVRLLPVTTDDPDPDCTTAFPEWEALQDDATGTLEVRVQVGAPGTNPCLVPETAGYTGLENHLYRVQIHDGNFDPTAVGGIGAGIPSFKWSEDNGSVLAAWVAAPSGVDVEVDRLGPGGADGFVRGGWVELGNDAHDLTEAPGVLAEVDDIAGSTLTLVDPGGLVADLAAAYDADAHPKARRWDSAGAEELDAGNWIDLELGIQVRFSGASSWRSGGHWVIPARTAVLPGTVDRQIEWPVDEVTGDPLPLKAFGPTHHRARLGLATFNGVVWSVTDDCRRFFAPLTEMVQFDSRGGDGQHAPSGHWLPAPVLAGVGLGKHPVPNALVRFTVQSGAGFLSAVEPDEDGGVPALASQIVVATDGDGVAGVWWRLGPGAAPEEPGDIYSPQSAQEVLAELLDPGQNPEHVPLTFVAQTLDAEILVDAGGNGQLGFPGETLEIALRARVSAGAVPVQDAHVAFEIQSTMLNGTALNQFEGGSLHASVPALVVANETWPGGNRTIRSVVRTDADGVAQIQWMLGTETGLPVQRVTAILLDDNDVETAQEVLFTAHLALAGEVLWEPCTKLSSILPPAAGQTVQDALDFYCSLLASLGTVGRVLTTGGTQPLSPSTSIPLSQFRGLELVTGHLLTGDPSQVRMQAAVIVEIENPIAANATLDPIRLAGDITVSLDASSTTLRWMLRTISIPFLQDVLNDKQSLARVTFLPGLLQLPLTVPWQNAFQLRG